MAEGIGLAGPNSAASSTSLTESPNSATPTLGAHVAGIRLNTAAWEALRYEPEFVPRRVEPYRKCATYVMRGVSAAEKAA
jgi:hypothetical protein